MCKLVWVRNLGVGPEAPTLKRFRGQFLLFLLLVECVPGCHRDPLPTYNSPRRILALTWENRPGLPETVYYFRGTNLPSFHGGLIGELNGRLDMAVVASNSTAWHLEIKFQGRSPTGASCDFTNRLICGYPGVIRTNLNGMIIFYAWFLSDDQLLKYDRERPFQ